MVSVMQVSLFDHSSFLFGDDNNKKYRFVTQEHIEQVFSETKNSFLVESLLNVLADRIFCKGYEIEITELGVKRQLSEYFIKNILTGKWTPELRKAFIHSYHIGFCVIVYYIASKNPLNPTEGILILPRVMDPEEYVIKWKTSKRGKRKYLAFTRGSTTESHLIRYSRVFMFSEPSLNGHISSPIQACLSQLKMLRELWSLYNETAYKQAYPPWIYNYEVPERKSIPNHSFDVTQVSQAGLMGSKLPISRPSTWDEAAHRKGTEKSYEFFQAMTEYQTQMQGQRQNFGSKEVYDPESNLYYKVARGNPFYPSMPLIEGQHLEETSHIPKPQSPADFLSAIQHLESSIAQSFGVPPDLMYDNSHRKFASNTELVYTVFNSKIRSLQNHFAEIIKTVYLDIYYNDHVKRIDEISEKYYRKNAEMKKTSDPISTKANPHILTADEQILLEKNVFFSVKFISNPMMNFDDAMKLWRFNIIDDKTTKLLAVGAYGLESDIIKGGPIKLKNSENDKKRKANSTEEISEKKQKNEKTSENDEEETEQNTETNDLKKND